MIQLVKIVYLAQQKKQNTFDHLFNFVMTDDMKNPGKKDAL